VISHTDDACVGPYIRLFHTDGTFSIILQSYRQACLSLFMWKCMMFLWCIRLDYLSCVVNVGVDGR